MRRALKVSAWAMGGAVLLMVVLGGAIGLGGNTVAGRGFIERLTFRLTSGYVKLSGLGGSFPTQLTLGELQLIDREGVWLTADDISLTWRPLRLLRRQIRVDTLHVTRLHMERAPVGGQGGTASAPYIDIGHFSANAVELGAPLTGTAVALSLQGNLRMLSLEDASGDVVARRLNGEGEYTLHLRFNPQRMDASLAVHEPPSGPLENILSLPGLGALSATATLEGPRNAELVDVDLTAGDLRARAHGQIDLTHLSADLDYSVKASAMAPRPDVAWAAVTLEGDWHGPLASPNAAGRLAVQRLRIGVDTRIASLTADLAASMGKLTVHATAAGLEIPGPQPQFFAKSPLLVDATVQMDEAAKPLELTASHALFGLHGRADTQPQNKAPFTAALELRVPELAPFTVFTGQDVHGGGVVKANLVHRPQDDALKLDATMNISGGTAAWIAYAGPRVDLQLSGNLSTDELELESLRIVGRNTTVSASGNATRAAAAQGAKTGVSGDASAFIKDLQARWQLDVSDLAAVSSDVAGNLKMTGRLHGTPKSLVADANLKSQLSVRGSASGQVEAALHAQGLPNVPSGTLQVHGMLDGSAVNVDAAVNRAPDNAFRLLVRRAEWKSAHIEGDLTADAALLQSHGQLDMRIGQLGDFDRLLGIQIAGSAAGEVGFVPTPGHTTQVQFHVDGLDLAVGGFGGNVHLKGVGVADSVALQVMADLPNLYGSPASLSAAADLNVGNHSLRLANASFGYRGETARLLAPAQFSFAAGFAVDDLKIGAHEAVLELKGQLAPELDLRASLRQVTPGLINVFSPGLLANGTVKAVTRLQGSPSSPTGDIRIDATDIRFADDAATGLPAVDLRGHAELNGNTAAVKATLNAGPGSQLTASGTAPLDVNGGLDFKIGGKLDLGLINPVLEARGMRATGELAVDATVTGNAGAPQVGGGITLASGSLRDYGRGVNLSDITAEVVGREGALEIKSFKATAASGDLAMTGTFGLLQPGWPVDLKITAKNAQPIASSIITANLDADIRVSGTARERIDVAGTVHINRATIGIPNSLPPEVAVLDVRRRGQAAPVDTTKQRVIGIALAIKAPQEVLVQGRGLDAEMGGEIDLSGTADEPVASGGFDLQRGSFTLAGNKLTFKQGRVGFDGSGLQKKIDPTLDFTAETTLTDTTATLRITGVADAPRFEFSSSPALQPDEIMARLLFGQPAQQLSALQLAQTGYALATLSGVGGGGGFNPLVKLQKSLGLDRLTVGTNTTTTATGTENSGAAIEAGRYVSKRVYIAGKQTTAGTSQVQVEVDLTKRLKLQTRLGNGTANTQGTTPENDPGSSVGLVYQFEY